MKNCLVAQSGGPTSVINASVVGVVKGNRKLDFYDKVYAGINGIEGILKKKLINLTNIDDDVLERFRRTPSAGLGSCRYKMKDFKKDDNDYLKFFKILEEYEIQTFFYIGGNDSMDTVKKLNEYAKTKKINKQVIGIPKTIDNDLLYTDHTPGFGSAAKYIATVALETNFDSSVYADNGVFILETMGRDTGWLAASATLARIDEKAVVDYIYLPEVEFSKEQFLQDVGKSYREKSKVYIVVSEGIRDENGNFLAAIEEKNEHDSFSHKQLGGVGNYLKRLIVENGITKRVKVLELGVTQRCSMHCASEVDLEEALLAGEEAVKLSTTGESGVVVIFKRESDYNIKLSKVQASEIANKVKYFPKEWINDKGNNVTKDAYNYIAPLIGKGIEEINRHTVLSRY